MRKILCYDCGEPTSVSIYDPDAHENIELCDHCSAMYDSEDEYDSIDDLEEFLS